jgi:hypothetical protein
VSFFDLFSPWDRLVLQRSRIAQGALVEEFLQRTPVLKTAPQLGHEWVGDIDGEAASFDSSIKDMTGVLLAPATAFTVLANTGASPQAQGAERRRPQIAGPLSEPLLDIVESFSLGRHDSMCAISHTYCQEKTFMFTIGYEFCDRN